MALSIAAMALQTQVQKLIPSSYSFDLISHQAGHNPNYQSHSGHKYYRLCVQFSCHFLLAFSYLRLLWLHNHWETYHNGKVEQFMVYCIILCLTVVAVSTYRLMQSYMEDLQFTLTQRCKLLPLPKAMGTNGYLMDRIAKIFVYSVGFGMLAFPALLLALPFAIDYDPVQFTIRLFLDRNNIEFKVSTVKGLLFFIFLKVSLSIYYFLLGLHGMASFLSFLLFCITFGEGMQIYSGGFYVRPMKIVLSRYMHKFVEDIGVRRIFRNRARFGSVRFTKCYQKVRNCQIMLTLAINITADLFLVLSAVGVLLAASCGYVSLRLFRHLPILFWACCPVIFGFVIVVGFILTYLADKPNRNGLRFLRFWGNLVRGKGERRMLRACSEFGYCLGPFRNAKAEIGLVVTHIIFQCTANLLLVDGSRGEK